MNWLPIRWTLCLCSLFALALLLGASACGDANIRLGAGNGQACDGGVCPNGQTCYRDTCHALCTGSGDCTGNARCYEGRCASMDCTGVSCEVDETCHQGVCYTSCSEERDCQGATRCFAGGCVPTRCENTQCPEEQLCHLGVCYPEHPGCDDDGDCPPDALCRRGHCEASCQSNLDCPEPMLCVDPCGGAASCMDARTCREPNLCAGAACRDGQICRDGDCVAPCEGITCASGQFCFLDRCYVSPNGALCQGVNCPADFVCVSGHCHKSEGSCVPSGECPEGSICRPLGPNEAFCLNQDCGLMTCASGTVCQNGQCNPLCGPDAPCQAPQAICMELCSPDEGACAPGCYEECATSACPPGQTCSYDRCYADCWSNAECDASERCFQGRCVPLSCSGVLCGPGEVCDRGGCALPCQSNSECPGEATCRQGACTDKCDQTRCPAGQTCSQGVCYDLCENGCPDEHVCVRRQGAPNFCSPLSCEGVECPESGACYRGQCKRRCGTDDDCTGFETCDRSNVPRVCVGPCDEVVCPENTHCHQGQCYAECDYARDCPDAHFCHYKGLCLPGTCPDCSNGSVCNKNTFTCTLCTQVDRIWPTGEDCWMSTCRVATGVAMSRARFPSGVRTVVIALGAESETGAGVDAMSGGPLAYQLGAPILLTAYSQLSWSTRQELERLIKAPTPLERVVILGGPFAISNAVESAIRSLGVANITRVSGHTRMDTSIEVARLVNPSPRIVFLADAWVLDGHLASGVAAALRAPVILTDTDELSTVVANYLGANQGTIIETVVIGTVDAIPDAILAQIPTPTRRITGPNQYAVSAAIASYAIERGVDPSHIYVTEGRTLFDALSAGATGGILLVSERACLKNRPCTDLNNLTDAYLFVAEQAVSRVSLVGTGSALAPQVEADACAALNP